MAWNPLQSKPLPCIMVSGRETRRCGKKGGEVLLSSGEGGGSTSPQAVPSSGSSLVAAWEGGAPRVQQST